MIIGIQEKIIMVIKQDVVTSSLCGFYKRLPHLNTKKRLYCYNLFIRGLQIREGGNGENWEGPQFDPVVRPVEPESLSSLGAREHLPIEARKKACFMLWF